MKTKFKRITAAVFAAAFILACIPADVFASGSYYVSSTSLSVTQGSSTSFTFGATNAVGAFSISTDGGVSASCSSELWVDCSSVTIKVTGNTVGTGHVYISVYDGADYDGNDLSGKSYTVTVTVKSASGGTVAQTTTVSATEATTTAATTTTEETTEDPEIELLTVTVSDESFLVVKDISDIELPEGFEIEETVYNTVDVQTMVCDDVVLYVLEDEDGNVDYYILNEDGEFESLRYTSFSGSFCIFLDMPDDLDIPYGYSLVETEICGFTVEALAMNMDEEADEDSEAEAGSEEEEDTASAESEDESGEDSAKARIIVYYTVAEGEASSGADGVEEEEDTASAESEDESEADDGATYISDMVASSSGHYYVYCLYNAQKVLFEYDSENDILSLCTAIYEVEEEAADDADITEDIVIEEDSIDIEKLLFIEVIIACVIIVALVIVLIIVLVVKRKNKGDPDYVDDIDFEEESIFDEDELFNEIQSAPASFAPAEEEYAPEEDRKEEIKEENPSFGEEEKDEQSKESAAGSSEDPEKEAEDFLLNIDSFFDGEDAPEEEAAEGTNAKEAPEENKTENDGSPKEDEEEKQKEEASGVVVEDITEILSEEFSDMLKYVDEEEE